MIAATKLNETVRHQNSVRRTPNGWERRKTTIRDGGRRERRLRVQYGVFDGILLDKTKDMNWVL